MTGTHTTYPYRHCTVCCTLSTQWVLLYKQYFTYVRYCEDNYSMVGTYYSCLTQGWLEVLFNVVTDTLSTCSCTAGGLVTLLGGQVQKGPPYISSRASSMGIYSGGSAKRIYCIPDYVAWQIHCCVIGHLHYKVPCPLKISESLTVVIIMTLSYWPFLA
jgi:hypothetical protein